MSERQKTWSEEELSKLKNAIENSLSPKEIASLFPNRTFNSVNVKRKRIAKSLNEDCSSDIQKDLNTLIKKEEESEYKKKYTFALKQIKEKDELLKYHVLIQQNDVFIHHIKALPLLVSEAVPVISLSDWHIEEEVKKEKVDGINEYNLTIAKQRIDNLFVNALRLCKIQSKEIKINEVIIALLGDFISGNIHKELLANCQVPPMEAIDIAQEYIASGIQYFLDNSEYSLTIPCVVGNHARITDKIYSSSEQENSLEYSMYKNLARRFSNNERVKFIIPNSDTCYVEVFGKVLRFNHGHQIKYSNAIGGIHTQVIKWLQVVDNIKKADYTFFGHWHQYLIGRNYISNGSVIGIGCYGKNKFVAETPTQSFVLIDKERGKTVSAPIFL